jgi:glycosyltransferase involved in cell wall biosynthesis
VRIVHIIARLNDGGPARVIAVLARMLQERGHSLLVVAGATTSDEPDLSEQLRAQGIEVLTIPGLGRRVSMVADWQAWWRMRDALRAWKPDVIHTHTAKAGLLGRLAARSLHVPMVHTYHGHVLRGYFSRWISHGLVWIERWLARGSVLHALTWSQARELAQQYGIGTSQRWQVIPIPIAPVVLAPVESRSGKVLGFLGRLVPIKDVDLWLAVFERCARVRNIRGVICGDGGERQRLERIVQARGLDVTFTGFIPAGQALARMDALLISSRNEGLPLVAVEAAGVGIPVVAAAVGGLRDLGRLGVVTAVDRRVDALVEAVLAALDGQHASERARRAALACAPDVVCRRYEDLYQRVYADHARVHGMAAGGPRPSSALGS